MPPCAGHLNAVDNTPGAADTGADSISIMTLNQQVGVLSAIPLPGAAFLTLNTAGLVTWVGAHPVTVEGIFTTTGTHNVVPGILDLGSTLPPTASFPKGSRVFELACVTYTVTDGTATPPFQLMRRVGTALPVPNVDGIEWL